MLYVCKYFQGNVLSCRRVQFYYIKLDKMTKKNNDQDITIRVSTSIDKATKKKLEAFAKRDQRSLSNYIARVLTRHANRKRKPRTVMTTSKTSALKE